MTTSSEFKCGRRQEGVPSQRQLYETKEGENVRKTEIDSRQEMRWNSYPRRLVSATATYGSGTTARRCKGCHDKHPGNLRDLYAREWLANLAKLYCRTQVHMEVKFLSLCGKPDLYEFECYLTCNEHILICKSAGYRTLRYSLTRLVVAGQLDGKRSSKLSFTLTKLVAPLGEGGAANWAGPCQG